MNSYEKIETVIELIANGVNPTGRYISGRIIDASASFRGSYPLIVLYPYTINEDNEDVWHSAQLEMFFAVEDRPNTSPVEIRNILTSMAILSKQFTDMLKEYDGVTVRNIQKEPAYKTLSATLTGFLVRFQIQVHDDCPMSWIDYLPPDYNAVDFDTV